MKRAPDVTEEEWSAMLHTRKEEAERRMLIEDHKKGFFTLAYLNKAAKTWDCSTHSAEIRLLNGELPE